MCLCVCVCVCVCVRVLACLFESCWLLFLKSQSFPRTWISNYATLRWRTFAVSVGLRWTRSIMMEPANRIHHGCCFKRQPLHVVLCPCVHPAVDRTPLLSGGSNTQPSSLAICSNITSPRAHSFASKCLRLCVCVCVCVCVCAFSSNWCEWHVDLNICFGPSFFISGLRLFTRVIPTMQEDEERAHLPSLAARRGDGSVWAGVL